MTIVHFEVVLDEVQHSGHMACLHDPRSRRRRYLLVVTGDHDGGYRSVVFYTVQRTHFLLSSLLFFFDKRDTMDEKLLPLSSYLAHSLTIPAS